MRKGFSVLEAKRLGTIVCDAETTILEAATRMDEEDIGSLVVVDGEGCLIGIITRFDLLRAQVARPDWDSQPVADYMSRQVITVPGTALLMDVARLLVENRIQRVVVAEETNGKQRPLAVVSASDIVYHMVKTMA